MKKYTYSRIKTHSHCSGITANTLNRTRKRINTGIEVRIACEKHPGGGNNIVQNQTGGIKKKFLVARRASKGVKFLMEFCVGLRRQRGKKIIIRKNGNTGSTGRTCVFIVYAPSLE